MCLFAELPAGRGGVRELCAGGSGVEAAGGIWARWVLVVLGDLQSTRRFCKARTSPQTMMAAFPPPLGAGTQPSSLQTTNSPSIQVSKLSISSSSSRLLVLGVSSGKRKKIRKGAMPAFPQPLSAGTPPAALLLPNSPSLIHVSRSSMSAVSQRMPVLAVTSGQERKCPVGQCQLSHGHWVQTPPGQLCCPQTHHR